MGEPTVRCSACGAQCPAHPDGAHIEVVCSLACFDARELRRGIVREPRVRCPECNGDGCAPGVDLADHDCERCSGIGSVLACLECHVMPQDPIWAPACSSVCREVWERRQPTPIVRKAP